MSNAGNVQSGGDKSLTFTIKTPTPMLPDDMRKDEEAKGDGISLYAQDNQYRNKFVNENLDVQFRPYYKNADASKLSLMRTPQWERKENRAFADFKYIPENGQTFENASGYNKIWNDHLHDQTRRFSNNFITPRLFEPTGTNIDLPDGYEQTYYGRPDPPKKRRINTLKTDTALLPAIAGYQDLVPDYTGTHQKQMSSFRIDRNTQNYQYGPYSKTQNFCGNDYEYLPGPAKSESKPFFKNKVYEKLYSDKNSKYHNLKHRLMKH